MLLFAEIFHLLRQQRKVYLWLNITYYGLFIGGMIWVSRDPGLTQTWRTTIRANFNQPLTQAYDQGLFLQAAYLTFVNNFRLASLLAMTLPSLFIPFWGLAIGAVRAVLWGLALSPIDPSYSLKLIPHSLAALLEGQGYVLAMPGVYVLWRNCLWPHRAGVETRWQGYVVGLRQTAFLYIGVFLLLAVGAVYKAWVAIYLIPTIQ